MKVLIVFHSVQGHVYRMAQAVATGAWEVPGAEVVIRRVPETLPPEVISAMKAEAIQEEIAQIPICAKEDLTSADAIIFGTPTRFGNMSGQMRQFLDTTGGLWASGALVGKIGSVFTSTGTQHGGQESTILSFHITLLHHGMLIAGLPFSYKELSQTSTVAGGSPYGAGTIAGGDGSLMPNEKELDGAKFQGRYVAELAAKLAD